MNSSNMMLIVTAEIALLLLIVCIVLALDEDDSATSYLAFIEQQIETTRDHHKTLKSGQDIVLDIAPEAPLAHRTPALRHAMLLAEKNALGLGKTREVLNWA